jgi:predicted nucleotidyltransferase component of viral defense system
MSRANDNIRGMVDRYEKSKIREQTKVREVLQQTALLGLERQGFFEKAAFYGGTALRVLYGLDRFSEDMDFSLIKPDPSFDFMPFLEGMKKELLAFGFQTTVTQKIKSVETAVVSAFMKMNTIQLYIALGEEAQTKQIPPREKIHIKLEIDIDPPIHFRFENRLVLNPVPFYVLTLHKSDLFAGKMHAILYRAWKGRVKGRDWYDLIWYIQNKISLSISSLEACMRQAGNLRPQETLSRERLIELLHEKICSIDWESAKADVRAFASDPQKLDIWSSEFFFHLLDHLQIE